MSNLVVATTAQVAIIMANHLESAIIAGATVEQVIAKHERDMSERKCKRCGSILLKQQETYCSNECQHAAVADRSKIPSEDELRRLVSSGLSNVKISKIYGISDRSVGKWRVKYGI